MSTGFNIKSAEYISSHNDWNKLPLGNMHEYAFIGRSNVGKSSLINMLAQRKSLAMVSKTPGKTKLLNLFQINKEWNLVDMPGYGYAKTSKEQKYEWGKISSSYLRNRKNLVNIFVLIDSNIPPQEIDQDFIGFLGEKMLPFSIVFTKIDKSSKQQINSNIDAFKKEMLKSWEELPPVFLTSAAAKIGREEILAYISQLNREIDIRKREEK